MKTTSAQIIYDALSVSLYLDEIGGSTSQKKSNIDGSFDPDRTITPMQLVPRLDVIDPNHVLTDGDHSSELIDTRWYIGTDDTGERITSSTSGFTLGEFGRLTVKRNVEPSAALRLFFTCAFIDSRTGQTFRYKAYRGFDTALTTELNLSLELNVPEGKMAISPFKNHANREVVATFRNGGLEVPAAQAVYQWLVRQTNADGSRSMRAIADTDLFYVSGQGTPKLVIDRRYIDQELIGVKVYHKLSPTRVLERHFKAYRWYGQWTERPVITKGKLIRPGQIDEIECKCIIDSPKGEITSPEQYFDIEHFFSTNRAGDTYQSIGYGETSTVSANKAGKDPTVIPVFGVVARELSALRQVTINGADLTIGGAAVVIQVPSTSKNI